jgi:hypothetical protein
MPLPAPCVQRAGLVGEASLPPELPSQLTEK